MFGYRSDMVTKHVWPFKEWSKAFHSHYSIYIYINFLKVFFIIGHIWKTDMVTNHVWLQGQIVQTIIKKTEIKNIHQKPHKVTLKFPPKFQLLYLSHA